MSRKTVLIFITFLFTLALSACGSSGGGGGVPATQPTNLDPSFGVNGKVTTEFISGSPAEGYAMAIQGDDKIVMAGYAHNGADYDFALARYNIDGSLDTSFGPAGTGKVMTNFSSSSDDRINAVVIDGSGRIVVAGSARVSGRKHFALARYDVNGNLDTSFGSGTGMVTTPFYGISLIDDQANAIAVQTDGKIVVAGEVYNGTSYDFALARYNVDGSLDTSFNNLSLCFPGFICNGIQRTDFNSDHDAVFAVVIRTDGKIVVAGYADGLIGGVNGDFALARYNTDGSLDTSFGSAGTGKVTTPFYSGSRWIDIARAMLLQTDGKIVVAGKADNGTNYDFALARYNADGTLDTSFNNQTLCVIGNPCSGQVVTDFNSSYDVAYAVAIQGDDKIVVAGYTYNGADRDFALARYNADGSMDTNFGPVGTGLAVTDFSGSGDRAYAVALQSDGKIVAAGSTGGGGSITFALARYLP